MSQEIDLKNFLSEKVNLNQTRLNLLSQRVQAIQTYLLGDETFGDTFSELLPQGSFAIGTIIKPVGNHEFDADVLLPMDEIAGWEAKDYVENLYTAFGRSSTYATMRGRHSRCVRIDYAGDFHVDVVPFVTRNGSTYITNRVTNEYESSAPDQFTEWVEEQDRVTNGNLVKVVRLLKYLRDHKQTYSIPSVTLTAALAHRVDATAPLFDADSYDGIGNTLKTLTGALRDHLALYPLTPPYIKDPGTGQDLTDRWTPEQYKNFRTRFTAQANLIEEACGKAEYADALPIWRSLFGPDFGTAAASLSAAVSKHYIEHASSEKFLDRDFRIPTSLNLAHSAKVVGEVVPKRGFRNRPLPKTGDRVDKGRSLIFKVKTNVPAPYDVYWKIRNHGEEAAQANALRGDIHKDDGSHTRRESTSYIGHHYVEALIVKDGVCVAKDRQPVIVI